MFSEVLFRSRFPLSRSLSLSLYLSLSLCPPHKGTRGLPSENDFHFQFDDRRPTTTVLGEKTTRARLSGKKHIIYVFDSVLYNKCFFDECRNRDVFVSGRLFSFFFRPPKYVYHTPISLSTHDACYFQ